MTGGTTCLFVRSRRGLVAGCGPSQVLLSTRDLTLLGAQTRQCMFFFLRINCTPCPGLHCTLKHSCGFGPGPTSTTPCHVSLLQVQNRIDDIAMAFERLHAMVTGQDPLATAIFFWRCLLLATGESQQGFCCELGAGGYSKTQDLHPGSKLFVSL